MLVTTLSVAFSVIVVKIHFKSPEHRPPMWLRKFIYGYLSKLVCISIHKSLKPKPRVKRDTTWSETLTDDLRSQNSHSAALTPDPPAPTENYELMAHAHIRRKIINDDPSFDVTSAGSLGTRIPAQEVHVHSASPNEWRQIAEVLDRFFFYSFLFFLIVPTCAILGLVRLFKPEL
jgi:hypothetical protein